MCIFFLSSECPFAGLEPMTTLSVLFDASRRSSTEETTSSAHSYVSSRSSMTTMSSYSYGSSDSLNEMTSTKEPSKASISEHQSKKSCNSTTSAVDPAAVSLRMEDAMANDYITAINTLTNSLENKSVQIGRCVDPTSPAPSLCKNFRVRHCASRKQGSYFENCSKCTDVGRQWQESREGEGLTWEQLGELNGRAQKLKKAETGMCSDRGCDGCRPTKT